MSAISRLVSSSICMHAPKGRQPVNLSLYLVANRSSFKNEKLFFEQIEKAVKGGASCVQLRDDRSDFAATLRAARTIKNMLNGTPFFINTLKSFEVTREIEADGVYLEKKSHPSEARKLLGEKAIIGISVKTIDDVIAAEQMSEIDYLSVKVSPSKQTCPRNDEIWGMEGLRRIRAISSHRIVAIGGLTLECVESIYRELRIDDGVAMAGGLMREDDPCATAQKIQAVLQKARGAL